MTEEVSTIQWFYLQLIYAASFNNFNGETVVKDLLGARDLWKACIMVQDSGPGITLRDLASDYNNVSTLYILSSGTNMDSLQDLAEQWGADEIDWLQPDEVGRFLGSWGNGPQNVLRIWWD